MLIAGFFVENIKLVGLTLVVALLTNAADDNNDLNCCHQCWLYQQASKNSFRLNTVKNGLSTVDLHQYPVQAQRSTRMILNAAILVLTVFDI